MKRARELERGGGGQQTQKTHNRHARLGDGRPDREAAADEHRPGNVPDEVSDDRAQPQRLAEPRAEHEQQALHGNAERDRQPGHPEEFGPEVGRRVRRAPGRRVGASLFFHTATQLLGSSPPSWPLIRVNREADYSLRSSRAFLYYLRNPRKSRLTQGLTGHQN